MTVDNLAGQTLLLASTAATGLLLAKLSGWHRTLCCLLAGLGLSAAIANTHWHSGIDAGTLQPFINHLILPLLVFHAIWSLPLAAIKRWLWAVLLLALPGVAVATFTTGALLYAAFNHPEQFPWLAALLTAVILASSAPDAVVEYLRRRNPDSALAHVLHSEGLLADATVITLFGLLLASLHMSSDTATITGTLVVGLGGAVIMGAFIGLLASIVLLTLNHQSTSTLILLLMAFGSFYVASHILHISGVLTTASATLVAKRCLKDPRPCTETIDQSWQWLWLLLQALAFVLLGLLVSPMMFIEHWQLVLLAILASICGRAASVYSLHWLGRPQQSMPKSWPALLTWAGGRGTVAIALALALPTSLPYWQSIQAIVFAVVMTNTVIQTPTLVWHLKHHTRQ